MSVQSVLETNKQSGRGTLVGYFPAGYPTVEDSIAAFVALAQNGCDILEVGVPLFRSRDGWPCDSEGDRKGAGERLQAKSTV